LIHENLYRSGDLKHLNFSEYIEKLSKDLYHAYTLNKSLVKLVLNIEVIRLDIDTSIPLGLILNELLTNSLKHAFLDGRSGMITVELLQEFKGRLKLSVSDNGIGFPSDLDFKNIDSLGMMIINTLTKQIEGEIHLDRINGTKFTVIFKDKEY